MQQIVWQSQTERSVMKHRIKSNHRWGGSDSQSTIGLIEIFSLESIFRCVYRHDSQSSPSPSTHALAVSSFGSLDVQSHASCG